MAYSSKARSNGAQRPAEVDLELPGRDFRDYLELLLRRSWIAGVCILLAVGGGAWALYRSVDTYTAEVLLQQKEERSPLESLRMAIGPDVSPEAVRSQINILQSRAVLEEVVDTLGLRLRVVGREQVRGRYLQEVRVLPEAPDGRYVLASDAEGRPELRDRDGQEVLLSAGPDNVIRGRGLLLRVVDPELLQALPLRISVTQLEAAIDDLRGAIDLSQVRGTTMIYARYTSPDPQLAAAVVNALATAYQGYGRRKAKESATRRSDFLQAQVSEVSDSLRAAQAMLQNYQERSSTIDPRIEGEALSQRLLDAEKELQQLEFEENLFSSVLISTGEGAGVAPGFERILALGSELIPGGAEIYRHLREYEAERRSLTSSRFGASESAPRVQSLDSLIAAESQELRQVVEEAFSVVQARHRAAQRRVDELGNQVGALPGRATTFSTLDQRVTAVQKTYDMLIEKYYEAQVAEAVEEGDVEVVDWSSVPEIPDPTRATVKLGLAGIMGLLLGLGLILLSEQLAVTVRDADDVRRATRLDVIGLIPSLELNGKKAGSRMVVSTEDVRGSESFRMLRTVVDFASGGDKRCLAVTSAEPSAGKSTVALNLAAAHARQGRKVLLVDGDLRRPTIHAALGISRAPGLADVLMGRMSANETIRHFTAVDADFDVLTCGVPVTNPAELFGSAKFTTFLQNATSVYDLVVIDLPPVLAVSESILVSTLADGVALVARSMKTSRFGLGQAVEQLRRLGTPLIGVVLNEAPVGGLMSKYRGYYDYEYARGSQVNADEAAGTPV